jgi:hypothetical protein
MMFPDDNQFLGKGGDSNKPGACWEQQYFHEQIGRSRKTRGLGIRLSGAGHQSQILISGKLGAASAVLTGASN